MVSKFCSRSQGQPPGARRRAMISTKRAKPAPADSLCSDMVRSLRVSREFRNDHPFEHGGGRCTEAFDVEPNHRAFAEMHHGASGAEHPRDGGREKRLMAGDEDRGFAAMLADFIPNLLGR